METIIKKAIEGGYNGVSHQSIKGRWTGIMVVTEEQYGWIILDPLFWQALGKACGWNKIAFKQTMPAMIILRIRNGKLFKATQKAHIRIMKRPNPNGWKKHALRFHEINLTQGWNAAVEYLYQLLEGK